jgi:hypothetical protein
MRCTEGLGAYAFRAVCALRCAELHLRVGRRTHERGDGQGGRIGQGRLFGYGSASFVQAVLNFTAEHAIASVRVATDVLEQSVPSPLPVIG